jgi:hypothetical protein
MSFALSRDVRYRLLFNEAVVIRQDASEVLGLNLVGARILEWIDRGISRSAMIEKLAEEFDVNPAELQADVDAFVRELVALGIVESAPLED